MQMLTINVKNGVENILLQTLASEWCDINMFMSIFKWEARILNKIYRTDKFNRLLDLDLRDAQKIDYLIFFNVEPSVNNHQLATSTWPPANVINSANLLCKMSTKPTVMQTEVARLNEFFEHISQEQEINYTVMHVMVYSCLSKCRIWPKVLKSGRGFVPHLIDFYNEFTLKFNGYLDFKFDPIILSQKYTKIMNKVKQKKKDNPKFVKVLRSNDIVRLNEYFREFSMLELEGQELGSINKPDRRVQPHEGSECFNALEMDRIKEQINNINHQGMGVAHIAVQSCDLKVIETLKLYGVDFQALDHEEQTAIFYAIKRADMHILAYLVETVKVNINHRECQMRTPLYLAAFEGDLQIVDYLHRQGADPELPSKLGRTPLSKACYLGNVEVVKYLIKLGVDLTRTDLKGRTALHNAAWGIEGGRDGKRRGSIRLYDSPQSARLMIQAGHPVDFSDHDGFTPLFSAVSSKANRSLRLLVSYGASLQHLTMKQQSVVFIAAKYGHLSTIRLLIELYSCQFINPDIHGYTPLCASVTMPQGYVFHYLCDKHLENNIKIDLIKVIECCIQYDRLQNLQYLLDWLRNPEFNDHKTLKQLIQFDDTEQKLPKALFTTRKYSLKQKLHYLLIQLQQLNFLIPLINSCCTNPKHKSTLSTDLENLTQFTQIDPKIRTNIKAQVPTITTNISTDKQIAKHIVQMMKEIIDIYAQKQINLADVSDQELRSPQQSIDNEIYHQIIDAYCLVYNHKVEVCSDFVSSVISNYKYINNFHLTNIPLVLKIEIHSKSNQRELLRILRETQSNLTISIRQVQKTLKLLVKYRLSGVIIALYNQLNEWQDRQSEIGIYKYNKQQLLNMLIDKNYEEWPKKLIKEHQQELQIDYKADTQSQVLESSESNKISLLEYCLHRGISDMYVYLLAIANSNGLIKQEVEDLYAESRSNAVVEIPNYALNSIEMTEQQSKFTLQAVDDYIFNYQSIIQRLSVKQLQIYDQIVNVSPKQQQLSRYKPRNHYHIVTEKVQLLELEDQVSRHTMIGIDTEHYNRSNQQYFVCLIQVAVGDTVYLIDPFSSTQAQSSTQRQAKVTQEDISLFLRALLSNKQKIKIFHAYQNDLKWLNQDYGLCSQQHENYTMHNVIDTARLYSCLRGFNAKHHNSIGLRTLANKYLGYDMNKEFQQADWRIRPLFAQMREYAAIDAEILAYIYLEQIKQLQEMQCHKQVLCMVAQVFGTKKSYRSRGIRHQIVSRGHGEEHKHIDKEGLSSQCSRERNEYQ